METLRIGMFNPFFYPFLGGTEHVIYEIGKRLVKKGHKISVYTSLHLPNLPKKEEIDGIEVHRVDAHIVWKAPPQLIPPFPIFTNFNQTSKEFMKDVDIAHIHNRFIFSYLQIRHLGKIKDVTLTIHNATPQNIDLFTDISGQLHDKTLLRRAYKYLSGATAITKAALDMTLYDYKGKKDVIYNGVDSKLFRPLKRVEYWDRIPRDKPIVMTNCRLVKQKGIDYLIKAMKGVNARLVVFGRGPLENELKELAKKEEVDAIFITERISNEELVQLINLCDIFVLPSLYETFGLAVAEAMACGKAVISTNIHGLPEVVGDGGLLVSPRDVEGMRAAINFLIEDEKYRKKIGKKARERVIRMFNWDDIALRYEKFYKDVL
ncbi:MAG: glycosyltransferase family 4 protein [Candidatus Bilamarchaeaceae archaeon]